MASNEYQNKYKLENMALIFLMKKKFSTKYFSPFETKFTRRLMSSRTFDGNASGK